MPVNCPHCSRSCGDVHGSGRGTQLRGITRRAVTALRSVREIMTRFPSGAGHWLSALDFYLYDVKEIAVLGESGDGDTRALVTEVYRNYLPNRALLGGNGIDASLAGLPLMEGRDMVDGRATAYVCQDYVCQLPVHDAPALAGQLTE